VTGSAKVYGCPVEFALDVLGGKWKSVILARLKQGPCRYAELRRLIPGLSDKVLTERLQGLCDAGLAELVVHEGARRYRLSPRGETLAPVLQALHDWGDANAAATGARIRPAAAMTTG
jgi:DNA-binding HxlR family transcriptional regulator